MPIMKNDAFFVSIASCFYILFLDGASSSSAEVQCSNDKEKKCPGFGDTLDLVACCPSKVETGDYYCCTLDEKRRSEYSWKDDFVENFAEIIGGVIAALLVTFTLVVVCCFFCSCCYLNRHRQRRRRGSETCRRSACPCPNNADDVYFSSNQTRAGNYSDVRTSEPLITSQPAHQPPYHQGFSHLQPKPYDAPPPYPVAQQCPAFTPPLLTIPTDVEFQNNNLVYQHNFSNIQCPDAWAAETTKPC